MKYSMQRLVQRLQPIGAVSPEQRDRNRRERLLPSCVVLASAALRGEGTQVSKESELRVIGALGIERSNWQRRYQGMWHDLLPEAREPGFHSEPLTLTEAELHALEGVKLPVEYLDARDSVMIAHDQEVELRRQVATIRPS